MKGMFVSFMKKEIRSHEFFVDKALFFCSAGKMSILQKLEVYARAADSANARER